MRVSNTAHLGKEESPTPTCRLCSPLPHQVSFRGAKQLSQGWKAEDNTQKGGYGRRKESAAVLPSPESFQVITLASEGEADQAAFRDTLDHRGQCHSLGDTCRSPLAWVQWWWGNPAHCNQPCRPWLPTCWENSFLRSCLEAFSFIFSWLLIYDILTSFELWCLNSPKSLCSSLCHHLVSSQSIFTQGYPLGFH